MYSSNEIPAISAAIFYYDEVYSEQTAKEVLSFLETYRLFPPEKIIIGHLNGSRSKKYRPEMRESFIKAYSEKDILGISWESADSRTAGNFLFANWAFTFYKKKVIVGEPGIKPWNVLSFDTTYEWMQDSENCRNFFNCVKRLIAILHPFVVEIDDVSNAVAISRSVKRESLLIPRHLHTPRIYWGNYWGPDICARYDVSKLKSIVHEPTEEIEGGLFFTLTDNVFQFNSNECKKVRKKLLSSVLQL